MILLHLLVEGRSEETFVKKVLCPHLIQFDVFADVWCVQTKFDKKVGKKHKGGLPSYHKIRKELVELFKQFSALEHRFSTFFDLYALPGTFPGYKEAKLQSIPLQKVRLLEDKISQDICEPRLIPYIQLHEFESLILCDPQMLDWAYIEHDSNIRKLKKMVYGLNPEEINDGVATAPSKRIKKCINEYNKGFAMDLVVPKIDLSLVRSQCPHFDEWLTKLEGLNC